MKIYISADIEGVTGINHWDETELSKGKYFAEQMTREVSAACEGAIEAGAKDILVNDAHGCARNIDFRKLAEIVRSIRGWANDPLIMMQGIDEEFDAVIFIGYHTFASSNKNPLAHTMNTELNKISINGEAVAEFHINSFIAEYFKVPVVFISGDKEICEYSKELIPEIKSVTTIEGIGKSTISIHPNLATKKIKEEVKKALSTDLKKYRFKNPEHFKVELDFKRHEDAFKASFYPGMKVLDSQSLQFESDSIYEVLRMMLFTIF